MKKLLKYSLILFTLTFIATSCSDDDDDIDNVIAIPSLPQASRAFIDEHFPTQTITLAKEVSVADPVTRAKYFVYLTNGYEIDFDFTGAWVSVEVEDKSTELPASVLDLLPTASLQYVRINYPNSLIKEIQKLIVNNQLRYEVELNNDIDLSFDADGQFIGIDD